MTAAEPSTAAGSRDARSVEPAVLSRHTGARHRRCDVRAWNLNAWCTLSGNPFVGTVTLQPNSHGLEHVAAEFGTLKLREGTDTMVFFLSSSAAHEHAHRYDVEVSVLDRSERALAVDHVEMAYAEHASATLSFGEAGPGGLSLRMSVAFKDFAGGPHYGNVRLAYLLAYKNNDLVELFNDAGSDKGTKKGVGRSAVPHCYAVQYFDLLKDLRERSFRMLEIGLQSNGGAGYTPTDAPSLRVWREFFPQASIYGYDINDFSFFEQDRTTVVRADQSSREDLDQFISEHAREPFALVLDDGSHASSHQQISLARLFPCVEPGGLYVIEDLHWQPFRETPTTLELLQNFNDSGQIQSPCVTPDEVRYLEEHIERVEIHCPNDSEFAVIYKRTGG